MKPSSRTTLHTLFAVSFLTLLVANAHAQIYKWVDEDGKVHFGDKPSNTQDARSAQEVTVQEAYVPTPATSAMTQTEIEMRQREAATQRSMKERLEREERKAEEDLAKRQESEARTADICAAVLKQIKALSEIEVVNGIPTYYYKTHADGTDYTSAEQDAYVQDLRAQAQEFGCKDIPDTTSN